MLFVPFPFRALASAIVFALAASISATAHAQVVKSLSVDAELKRLAQVCVKYASLGQTAMPDLSQFGYKRSKIGLVGSEYFAYVSLDKKKQDTSALPKGTALGASLRWKAKQGHECTVLTTIRHGSDINLARGVEAKLIKHISAQGFKKTANKDKKGRPFTTYNKGANALSLYSTVSGRGSDGTLSFKISNRNNDARKN